MAANLPWISTDVGNAKELPGGVCTTAVKNTKRYNVIDTRVKRLLASGIKKVWDMPQYANEGRLCIEKSLTWNKILPKYREIIEVMYA